MYVRIRVCMYVRAEKPGVPRRRGLLDCRSTEITVFRSVEQYGFLFRGCRSGVAERISGRYRAVQKTRIALGPGQKSMQQVSEPLQTPLCRLAVAQGWVRGNEWQTEGAPTQERERGKEREGEIRRWCKKGACIAFFLRRWFCFYRVSAKPRVVDWYDTDRYTFLLFTDKKESRRSLESDENWEESFDGIFRSLYRSFCPTIRDRFPPISPLFLRKQPFADPRNLNCNFSTRLPTRIAPCFQLSPSSPFFLSLSFLSLPFVSPFC